jgi:hypothetical protein
MTPCLFVGGCADGTMRDVDIGKEYYGVYFEHVDDNPVMCTASRHTYVRQIIADLDGHDVVLYMWDGLDLKHPFSALLQCYSDRADPKYRGKKGQQS